MSEHDHQVSLFQWLDVAKAQHPELALAFAIPNGGQRHKAVAAKLKAEGVKPGVPDVFLPVARCGYHGLFIEMKFGKNQQTPAQREWEHKLLMERYMVATCYSWEKARDVILTYITPKASAEAA